MFFQILETIAELKHASMSPLPCDGLAAPPEPTAGRS
jgi:hypothetical protein